MRDYCPETESEKGVKSYPKNWDAKTKSLGTALINWRKAIQGLDKVKLTTDGQTAAQVPQRARGRLLRPPAQQTPNPPQDATARALSRHGISLQEDTW